jgi:cytochrome c oxidase subunit 2
MRKVVWAAPLTALLTSCQGGQSAMDTAGGPAIHIGHLMFGITLVCTVIWLAVVIVLGWALLRQRTERSANIQNSRMNVIVGIAVGATAMIIACFTVASFLTTRAIGGDGDTSITVRGEQWWWRILYKGPDGARSFQTANEIHIPVGRNVTLKLESADVIHSFWVPSLAGKQDLVPGRTNTLLIRAERPGVYRGQCAEFCGLQHSHMAMMVVADSQVDYNQWLERQTAASVPTDSDEARQGKLVFMAKPCAACHTVRGTDASGTTGPDLSHVASRTTIAAGLLPTTRGSLAAWIADPQTLKPGNNMPMVPLSSDELRQVSAYLEGLQ